MNTNEIEGGLKDGLGKAQSVAGQVIDDPGLELDGDMKRAEGRMQAMLGQAQDRLAKAADQAASQAAKLSEQAQKTYADLSVQARAAAKQVDPFVREKPYAAAGLAIAAGLMLGLLYAGRGPKVVLIKTQR